MSTSQKAEVYVALLRGINVGGKNSLPMKALAAMFEKAGCSQVATYIQSGNVVFQADAQLTQRIPDLISKAILKGFKMDIPVIVRSAKELLRISKGNPFLQSGGTIDTVHVAFLAQSPSLVAVQSLDPQRSPGDEFRVVGREIYLHCPQGFGRTKLTNQYFDSKLFTTSTVRNWKTLLKLIEMTETAS
jgi:uncharacterized protein (DUF1697 family)